ncbi:MAG: hypothetical protein QM770_20960 [Tepidisphaeraceae bacterium]
MRALYQMSRTAGVGLQDYAAVNNLAVIGLACAVVSVALLVLFREIQIYYLTAAAGLVLSIVALVQVRRSNGTQAGMGLSLGGLLLSLGVIGVAGGLGVMRAQEDARHRTAIIAQIDQLGAFIRDGKFDEAYALTDPRFQDRVKKDGFTALMKMVRNGVPPRNQGMETMSSTPELIQIDHDMMTGAVNADAIMNVQFSAGTSTTKPRPAPIGILFALFGDRWLIHDIPGWFQDAPAKK